MLTSKANRAAIATLLLFAACSSTTSPAPTTRAVALSERVNEADPPIDYAALTRTPPHTRVTAPRATRSYVRHSYGVERWRALVSRYPWPVEKVLSIMQCESKGDPNAYNPRSGATGLLQILHGPFDPEANIALAFQMWQKRGFTPWVCA